MMPGTGDWTGSCFSPDADKGGFKKKNPGNPWISGRMGQGKGSAEPQYPHRLFLVFLVFQNGIMIMGMIVIVAVIVIVIVGSFFL